MQQERGQVDPSSLEIPAPGGQEDDHGEEHGEKQTTREVAHSDPPSDGGQNGEDARPAFSGIPGSSQPNLT
jgi:hypothetical protein